MEDAVKKGEDILLQIGFILAGYRKDRRLSTGPGGI
jgi:hypothetical protein